MWPSVQSAGSSSAASVAGRSAGNASAAPSAAASSALAQRRVWLRASIRASESSSLPAERRLALSRPDASNSITAAPRRRRAARQLSGRKRTGTSVLLRPLHDHLVRRLGVAAHPGDRNDARVLDHAGAQAQHLALDRDVGAVAEGDLDRARLDRDRADVLVDDLVGDRQAGGGVVDRQLARRRPRVGDLRLDDVGELDRFDDAIADHLVGHAGQRDQRQHDDDARARPSARSARSRARATDAPIGADGFGKARKSACGRRQSEAPGARRGRRRFSSHCQRRRRRPGDRPSPPPGRTLPPQVGHGNLGGAGARCRPTPLRRGART